MRATTLPTEVDWRTEGMVTPPKDQGTCGCCWAFATVGLFESMLLIGGQGEYDLSEEYVLECTTPYWNNGYDSSCNGGYVDFSVPMVTETGIPTEADYPYAALGYGSNPGSPTTPGICSSNSTVLETSINGSHVRYDEVTDDQMKELLTYGPVLVLINADPGFMGYVSGVYSGCPDYATSVAAINHAVVVVGYDADGNWIVKNSWGSRWGENGYGVVSKNADCAIKYQPHEIRGTNQPLEGNFGENMVLSVCLMMFLSAFLAF